MSGMVATQRDAETTTAEGVDRYVDTLYELVASGVSPSPDLSLTRVERYLHEHARSAKSLEALRGFFDEYGLTLASADPARPALQVLEPIPAVEPPPPAIHAAGLQHLEDASDDATLPKVALPSPGDRPYSVRTPWLPWALAGAAVVVGAVGTWGYLTMTGLRSELSRAQAQAADNRSAIQALGEQATEIRRDVGETGETLRRFERKNDVLLDALLPAPLER